MKAYWRWNLIKIGLLPLKMLFDFEIGAWNGSMSVFPTIDIRGCYYHYWMCLRHKRISLNLEGAFGKIEYIGSQLSLWTALTFLPEERVWPLFQKVRSSPNLIWSIAPMAYYHHSRPDLSSNDTSQKHSALLPAAEAAQALNSIKNAMWLIEPAYTTTRLINSYRWPCKGIYDARSKWSGRMTTNMINSIAWRCSIRMTICWIVRMAPGSCLDASAHLENAKLNTCAHSNIEQGTCWWVAVDEPSIPSRWKRSCIHQELQTMVHRGRPLC